MTIRAIPVLMLAAALGLAKSATPTPEPAARPAARLPAPPRLSIPDPVMPDIRHDLETGRALTDRPA